MYTIKKYKKCYNINILYISILYIFLIFLYTSGSIAADNRNMNSTMIDFKSLNGVITVTLIFINRK